MIWLHLLVMLFVILLASLLFTNALEHFGHRMNLSAGVIGSVFAAIATALPEASIPIIAIVAGTGNTYLNEEVSVGAILGAPFMLSTLSMAILGMFALHARGMRGKIRPEVQGLLRDLHYFLLAFVLAAIAMFVPLHPLYWRGLIGCCLVSIYIIYLISTCRASNQLVRDGHGVIPDQVLYISRFGMKESSVAIFVQILLAMCLLLYGAKQFIADVETVSHALKMSALLLSLLIIPVATELPEKINSILWIRQNKDTLSVSNITGAMVFQGTLLPTLGILLTPWQPSRVVETGIVVTIAAVLWLRYHASQEGLSIKVLFVNGGLYFLFLVLMLY